MFISVLVPTRDRAANLRRLLESLLSPANLEASDWEVIVADNGSTDDTSHLCREFTEKYLNHFHYVIEKTAGRSSALNAGLRLVRGDVVAMTDDDVIVAPDYLEGIRFVFTHYAIDGALGRAYLNFEGDPPEWFDERLMKMMSWRDYGSEVCEFRHGLTGTNMIVRADAFKRLGGFCPQLGVGACGAGEDAEFHERMRRAGCKLLYTPQITVRHRVFHSRLTKRYFRERFYNAGSSAALYGHLPSSAWRYFLYTVKEFLSAEAKVIGLRVTRRKAQVSSPQWDFCWRLGFLAGHLSFRRAGRPQLTIPSFS